MEALLKVIHQIDVAVRVCAIDEWKFDGGARVATVEDDEEDTGGREFGDEMPVQKVTV